MIANLKLLFFFTLIILSSSFCFAQADCPCCSESHRQFDFWKGDWIVKDTSGTVLGQNKIESLVDKCILSENWKGAKGSTGSSYNYFDRTDSTWNQLWIDNQGSHLKLKGKWNGESMVLRSPLKEGNELTYYFDEISWTPHEDGTVTQIWNILDENGQYVKTIFKGLYSKK